MAANRHPLSSEFKFLAALWAANIQSAMEFRVAFIAQVLGMILNDAAYFIFWIIFFDRFKELRGWNLSDMFILFGTSAAALGLAVFLFGNILSLSEVISKGQLDTYLSFPRPVLLHALASKSISNGFGDFLCGILFFFLSGNYSIAAFARFLVGIALGMVVFLSFMVLVHSLSFYIGSASVLSQQAYNAVITFAIYPIKLFEGGGRFILYFLLPAAFMGSVPAEFVKTASWHIFLELGAAALVLATLAWVVFHRGLQRYESGSSILVQS